MRRAFLFAVLFNVALAGLLSAHPVPRDQYDRIISVRFLPDKKPGDIRVEIDFRLEVDPQTVVLNDMKPFRKEIELGKIHGRLDYFKEFTRIYADIYARNFFNRLNGKELDWVCTLHKPSFEDEEGKPLDHLRCDFRFESSFTPKSGENQFLLKDLNYQDHPGKIQLSFLDKSQLKVTKSTVPDAKLYDLPFEKRGPDEEQALRTIRLRFEPTRPAVVAQVEPPIEKAPEPPPAPVPDKRVEQGEGGFSLLRMFVNSDYGLLLMLVIAAGVGAVHALTPGHGKTMVAAYLVGERGTVWHAVFLGIVTTLTHTGIVLLVAAGLLFLPETMTQEMQQNIQTGLGLGMGLVITCLGIFLFLQRLSGRADHFHIGGGHHHHHGHSHGHSHSHAPAPTEEQSGRRPFGWWALTILGITGGLIPCWDAIALLVLAVGMNLFWLAFPVLLAFSAGLASVLVLIGIAVVKFRNLLGDHWGDGKIIRALPIISAVVVTLMGFWICYEAVNGPGAHAP